MLSLELEVKDSNGVGTLKIDPFLLLRHEG